MFLLATGGMNLRTRTAEEAWRKYDRMEARLSAPLSARMLELAGISAGMRVLDLATGRGEPAIVAAHRVGPEGSVLGVDVSDAILAMARERAAEEGVANLELRTLDAGALVDLPAETFDATLIRWGLMFFADPVAALKSVRRALLPGGKLVVAVWAEPERVPYFTLPRRVLEKYHPVPPIDFAAPGTFHYADNELLRRDLERAGFRIGQVEELEVPVVEARHIDELVDWECTFGMARLLLDLPESVQRAWAEDFAAEAESFRDGDVLRLGGVTRLVVAS